LKAYFLNFERFSRKKEVKSAVAAHNLLRVLL
jgi:hypothetical protein